MVELEHFVNAGYGWTCRRCDAEGARGGGVEGGRGRGRFFSEGEAEERGEASLSTPALARWRDASRRTLVCPRCLVEENIEGG